MPSRTSSLIPADLRSRLETARLDTLALLRAFDQALIPLHELPHPELHVLYELDADCAEALWALDQPPGSLNLRAMVRDTLVSLNRLPQAYDSVLFRLKPATRKKIASLKQHIRAQFSPREAYNDIPPPQSR